MIPSAVVAVVVSVEVYQRGLVIDSQLAVDSLEYFESVSKGIGD